MSSKTIVSVYQLTGVAFTAGGSIAGLLFLATFIYGWSLNEPLGTKIAVEVILFLFILCAVFIIYLGIRMLARINRFYIYRTYLTNRDSVRLEVLSQRIGKDIEFVSRDLEKMIRRRFFTNVYIDTEEGVLAIAGYNNKEKQKTPTEVVECESCGAKNVRPVGGMAYCEYCKSPLE